MGRLLHIVGNKQEKKPLPVFLYDVKIIKNAGKEHKNYMRYDILFNINERNYFVHLIRRSYGSFLF